MPVGAVEWKPCSEFTCTAEPDVIRKDCRVGRCPYHCAIFCRWRRVNVCPEVRDEELRLDLRELWHKRRHPMVNTKRSNDERP